MQYGVSKDVGLPVVRTVFEGARLFVRDLNCSKVRGKKVIADSKKGDKVTRKGDLLQRKKVKIGENKVLMHF